MHEFMDAAIELLIYFTGVAVIFFGLLSLVIMSISWVVKSIRNALK